MTAPKLNLPLDIPSHDLREFLAAIQRKRRASSE